MAAAAIVAVYESASAWATFAAIDAGIAIGSELAFGAIVGGLAAGAVGLAGMAVMGAFNKPPGDGQTAAAAAQGVTSNVSSTVEPIPLILGTRRVSGTRVLVTTAGANNANLYIVVVHGEGEIDGSDPVWYFDDTLATDARFTGSGIAAPAAPGLLIDAGGAWLASGSSATYALTALYGSTESLIGASTTIANPGPGGCAIAVTAPQPASGVTGYNLYRQVAGVWRFVAALDTSTWLPGYTDAAGATTATAPPTSAAVSQWYTLTLHNGTDTQAADALLVADLPGKWTPAHQLCGLAYTAAKLVFTPNVWSGLPNIASVLRGRKVFDSRSGSTSYSENAALGIREYLTNTRCGRGLDASQIDEASFVTAANISDEAVTSPIAEARYRINAVVDTSATPLDNLNSLLAACRGWLIYTGGKYRLLLDRPWTGEKFDFTESNITGSWKISQPGKKDKFNRVKASWINPANNWQPDIVTVEDTTLRATQDHGLVLETALNLSSVTSQGQAMRIAMETLIASRFGLTVQFRALPEGIRAEVGDVVTITHATPGWTAKPFRVMKMILRDDDEVEVTVREYSDTVYSYALPSTLPAAPSTNLPDPFAVGAPGIPSVTESLYQTSGSAGVKSRASVSWARSSAPWVAGYQVQSIAPGGAWRDVADTVATSVDLGDLAPGVWGFRVRAETTMGRLSDWASCQHELLGLTAPPASVTGLTVVASSGHALASWALSPDLDVRIGGRIVLRWSPLTAGAAWENGVPLLECNGDAVMAVLPMLTGTYLAKAKDSTGNWSGTAAAWVLTSGSLTALPNSQVLAEAPAFTGARSGVALSGGALQLDSVGQIDTWGGNVDSWSNVDTLGGVLSAGTYDFSAPMDFGSVATRRFAASISAQGYDTGDAVDARSLDVDDWDSVDGTTINDATATLLAAVSDDAVAYGAWFPLLAGDLTCRAVKFRLQLASSAPTHNVAVSQSTVTANW